MSDRPNANTDFGAISEAVAAAESVSDAYTALSDGLAAAGYGSFILQAASWGTWMKVTNIRIDADKLRKFQYSMGISLNGYTCPVAKGSRMAQAQESKEPYYAEDPKAVVGDLMQSHERYMATDVTRGLGMGAMIVAPLPTGADKTPVLCATCPGLTSEALEAFGALAVAVGEKVAGLTE